MFCLSEKTRTFASLLSKSTIGCLAQLVQSICLTSRGSAVRIRQHPPRKWQGVATITEREYRAFSSAGSEHLPYKQRVGGSNPSTPTIFHKLYIYSYPFGDIHRVFSSAGSEHLPYKQRVGGSNPSTPTTESDLL